jgi:serine/threonine-protein kinase
VRVPGLVKAPESAEVASTAPADKTKTPPLAPLAPSKADEGITTQQTLGLVVGAVGLVGVGLGSYFGIRAIKRNSDADTYCSDAKTCQDQKGVDLNDNARRDATASNIAFAAGALLIGTGTVLYLTGGRSDADRVALVPLLGPGTAAASVSGRF